MRSTLAIAATVLPLILSPATLAQIAQTAINSPQDGNDQVRAEDELSRIAKVIAALEREMRSGEDDRTQASLALETHERAIDHIAREQRTLVATAARLRGELARLRAAYEVLEAQIESERQGLAGELRAAYAMGRGDRVRLLLQRRDPGTIARLLRYHTYFTRAQRERIVTLEQSLMQLGETERAIGEETVRLASIDEQLRERRAALEHERDLRARALATLNAELADNRSTVDRLKKDQSRLAKLIARLRDAINDVPAESEPPRSFRTLRGKLPWPVSGPLKRNFGVQRDGEQTASQGVLVQAPMGREVRSIAHGRVVFADWLRGFGLMVIVDHGSGYMSLYGHNQSLQREPGEWVSAGDPLATVGDSGGKEGAGLYFEIRHDGRPENPARWCSQGAKFSPAS